VLTIVDAIGWQKNHAGSELFQVLKRQRLERLVMRHSVTPARTLHHWVVVDHRADDARLC